MFLFKALFIALTILGMTAQACIRVHAVQKNRITGGSMTAQIWDNDFFYERQAQGKTGSSSNTVWSFTFSNGYKLDLWANGAQGRISIPNGWSADLRNQNTDRQTYCQITSDSGACKYTASETEACLNDGFGNCGGYTCGLCDFGDCPR
ncbi:hypothetical protein VTL71DRAFT_4858 [Oculimacula yallundae]|uniref:Uncharacterized protein n=1 Tax=Oculimacula yallundae TaxID=86028 RepID=A0ABR4C381_9HELO